MLKKIAVAMVAVGGLMVAAAPAQAAGHISLSLGLPLPPIPGVYVGGYAPAPVYAQPGYVQGYAPAYYGPPPVVYESARPYPYGGYYGGPRYYAPRVVYRGGYDRGYRGEYRGDRDHGNWHR